MNKQLPAADSKNKREVIARHRLSFTTVVEYNNRIVETITDAKVDIDAEKMIELIEFLNTLPSKPIGLINNRRNSYSIALSAYTVLPKNKQIKVFADNSNGKPKNYFVDRLWPKSIKFAFFHNHEEAMDWIEKKVSTETSKNN